jgi:hypothetical protein
MRTRIEAATLAVFLTSATVVFGQGNPAKDEKPAKSAEQKALDELIALALKNNPDLRVAEAKMREAEAELNRTRFQVTHNVVALRTKIDAARATKQEALNRLQRMQTLFDKHGAGQEELDGAKVTYERYRAEVAAFEAELPYLLGKSALEPEKDAPGAVSERARSEALAKALEYLAASSQRKIPSGTGAENTRIALEKKINVNLKNMSPKQIVADLAMHVKEIALVDNINAKDLPGVTLELEGATVCGVMQALEDLAPGLRFTVRDYGILVTYKAELPVEALSVHDFLKSDAGKEKPKGDAAKPEESTHNFIDLGSDVGLTKGHNLEIFRTKPQPKYLGTIRILEVKPTQSVGQGVRKPNEPIKEGDRVTSQVFVK